MFFDYSVEIRKAIYTTNAIESLNASLRKIIKTRRSFPNDEAIMKVLYLALHQASKKVDDAHEAVQILFRNPLTLVEELKLAEMKGELKKRLTQLNKYDLIIIDEVGYLSMSRQSRHNLFQLINSLYEYR